MVSDSSIQHPSDSARSLVDLQKSFARIQHRATDESLSIMDEVLKTMQGNEDFKAVNSLLKGIKEDIHVLQRRCYEMRSPPKKADIPELLENLQNQIESIAKIYGSIFSKITDSEKLTSESIGLLSASDDQLIIKMSRLSEQFIHTPTTSIRSQLESIAKELLTRSSILKADDSLAKNELIFILKRLENISLSNESEIKLDLIGVRNRVNSLFSNELAQLFPGVRFSKEYIAIKELRERSSFYRRIPFQEPIANETMVNARIDFARNCIFKDIERMKKVIEDFCIDVNECYEQTRIRRPFFISLLEGCCDRNAIEEALLLIRAGADLNSSDIYFMLGRLSDVRPLTLALENGLDPNMTIRENTIGEKVVSELIRTRCTRHALVAIILNGLDLNLPSEKRLFSSLRIIEAAFFELRSYLGLLLLYAGANAQNLSNEMEKFCKYSNACQTSAFILNFGLRVRDVAFKQLYERIICQEIQNQEMGKNPNEIKGIVASYVEPFDDVSMLLPLMQSDLQLRKEALQLCLQLEEKMALDEGITELLTNHLTS